MSGRIYRGWTGTWVGPSHTGEIQMQMDRCKKSLERGMAMEEELIKTWITQI
jgi:hypothetical protein